MLCCVILSAILGAMLALVRKGLPVLNNRKTSPLAWTPNQPAKVTSNIIIPIGLLSGRIKSFGFAFQGLGFVLRSEPNARMHVIAACLVLGMAAFLRVSQNDLIIIVFLIMVVWFAETINSAFEYLCDLISPDFHQAVKHAKDIAAGAVLITAIGAAIIGAVIFWPYLFAANVPAWPEAMICRGGAV